MTTGLQSLGGWVESMPIDNEELIEIPISFREVAIYLNHLNSSLKAIENEVADISRDIRNERERRNQQDNEKRKAYTLMILSTVVSPVIVALVLAVLGLSVK